MLNARDVVDREPCNVFAKYAFRRNERSGTPMSQEDVSRNREEVAQLEKEGNSVFLVLQAILGPYSLPDNITGLGDLFFLAEELVTLKLLAVEDDKFDDRMMAYYLALMEMKNRVLSELISDEIAQLLRQGVQESLAKQDFADLLLPVHGVHIFCFAKYDIPTLEMVQVLKSVLVLNCYDEITRSDA